MKKVKIGNKWVGPGYPCFIIAEIGVNHNGDVKLAKRLIDKAVAAGADAVKFQTFRADALTTKTAPKAKYQQKTTGGKETQNQMLKKLELSAAAFKKLADYAKKKNIMFLSSPFDIESVDILEKIGIPAYKIASGEITNLPLLKYVARQEKQIILSTGMATLKEIETALKTIRKEGVNDIILLQCVTSYPARPEDINLRAIKTLRKRFKLPVGFSDHSVGTAIPAAAAALGACLVEKHFTLSKDLVGPDHKASLEPDELKAMVRNIREVERALGNGAKAPTKGEEEVKKIARKSIVARVDIPKGAAITEALLACKRPGHGLAPSHFERLIGKTAKVQIKKDSLVKLNMFA